MATPIALACSSSIVPDGAGAAQSAALVNHSIVPFTPKITIFCSDALRSHIFKKRHITSPFYKLAADLPCFAVPSRPQAKEEIGKTGHIGKIPPTGNLLSTYTY